ncbi:MAG: DUF998 domain-containing protein [Thermocladium sp.]
MGSRSLMALTGIIAAIVAWAVILISIWINPWFIFTRNAFSDLGGPSARYPWIYNYGLILTAALVLIFSIHLIQYSRNKLETVGASFISIAALFLAMIGVFHEGTYPHVFVSTWFFAQFDLAIITWGLGSAMSGNKEGWIELLMGLASPIPAILIKWPSAATLEAYGIAIIDVFTIIVTYREYASRQLSQ